MVVRGGWRSGFSTNRDYGLSVHKYLTTHVEETAFEEIALTCKSTVKKPYLTMIVVHGNDIVLNKMDALRSPIRTTST
ncbi:predicted protein [Sclerotinia sclerotiorum 1980 UF-70]|uniref:Uncharacterized protein n=1 Tax=Sclerotinia sclerotiorum (strain ATCC 18683 / 1980 / Ss-1) TaxID=665079 RepID=A7EX65_SCLS1|nr:predicted protein [Sclerotinia sclerotiorum 1980 UF-70]EDN94057.1 predicted protein [Sclerotinia sclerotiorum 1980 UF-70]